MTTTAHTVRRLYGGATRQPLPRSDAQTDRFSYYDLMPQMRPKTTRKQTGKLYEIIEAWLADNGPATARQIADGINHAREATNAAMRHCKNIERCGNTKNGAGIWRMKDGISE